MSLDIEEVFEVGAEKLTLYCSVLSHELKVTCETCGNTAWAGESHAGNNFWAINCFCGAMSVDHKMYDNYSVEITVRSEERGTAVVTPLEEAKIGPQTSFGCVPKGGSE